MNAETASLIVGSPETDSARAAVVRIKNLVVEYRGRSLGQGSDSRGEESSLEVRAGEVFGFLGPNGAGKTSTMQVLLGFRAPTSGAAFMFDIDVRDAIARQRIGYLPELTYYYKFLTAEELLRFLRPDLQNSRARNRPADRCSC